MINRLRIYGCLLPSLIVVFSSFALAESPGKDFACVSKEYHVCTDKQGTKNIQHWRVPIPASISEEAQAFLAKNFPDNLDYGRLARGEITFAQYRAGLDAFAMLHQRIALERYPVNVERIELAGVPVDVVTPKSGITVGNRHKVLINMHGGAGIANAGSIIEAIPIAALSGLKVISVDYRLMPEHPFPAAVEDVLAVYREVLKQYAPVSIGVYGASFGGLLTAQTMAALVREKLPAPAALGILANGAGAPFGDAAYVIAPFMGFDHKQQMAPPAEILQTEFPEDGNIYEKPYFSTKLLRQFAPTLLMTGTRDGALSTTLLLHRALYRAGVPVDLHVWDAMPHVHWYYSQLPEAQDASEVIATYFHSRLK